MSWSSKRKPTYLGSFAVIVLVIAVVIYFLYFYEAPNCEDGIQNQNESGIDCGGVCSKVCSFQAIDPVVLWSRIMKVADGVYNVIALVENPNPKTQAKDVEYSFKLYDENSILISERLGKVDILPRSIFPIFEGGIFVQNRIPARSPFFEFTSEFDWNRISDERPELIVTNKNLTQNEKGSQLEATIENESVQNLKNIEVTAILSDYKDNVVAFSQTSIDRLERNDSKNIVFTWNEMLASDISKIEVIPLLKTQ